MAEGRGNRYSTGEAIEATFADEDSNDETFDCGYDLDIIRDSENEGDSESSDLDILYILYILEILYNRRSKTSGIQ